MVKKRAKEILMLKLGHRLLITSDEHELIMDYKVMINETDTEQVTGLIERIEDNFGKKSIYSISFDKGFSSKTNKEFAAKTCRTSMHAQKREA